MQIETGLCTISVAISSLIEDGRPRKEDNRDVKNVADAMLILLESRSVLTQRTV